MQPGFLKRNLIGPCRWRESTTTVSGWQTSRGARGGCSANSCRAGFVGSVRSVRSFHHLEVLGNGDHDVGANQRLGEENPEHVVEEQPRLQEKEASESQWIRVFIIVVIIGCVMTLPAVWRL